jgi:DNA replication factor GINS
MGGGDGSTTPDTENSNEETGSPTGDSGTTDHPPDATDEWLNDSPDRPADEALSAVDDGPDTPDPEADQPDADIDRKTVRITDDVGEIFGVDQRSYDLSTDDVVTLPADNADPLVERDAAEPLE